MKRSSIFLFKRFLQALDRLCPVPKPMMSSPCPEPKEEALVASSAEGPFYDPCRPTLAPASSVSGCFGRPQIDRPSISQVVTRSVLVLLDSVHIAKLCLVHNLDALQSWATIVLSLGVVFLSPGLFSS